MPNLPSPESPALDKQTIPDDPESDPGATVSGVQVIPEPASESKGRAASAPGETASPSESAPNRAAPNQVAPKQAAHSSSGFTAAELAMVCSRFPLGIIRRVREYKRGSSRSPKVVLEADAGTVLLKRRAPSSGGRERVEFCHAVQHHLETRGYPLARLIRMHGGGSALFLDGHAYEMFEFVPGKRYDRSEPATSHAGTTLALLHRLLADFDPELARPAPSSCFHAIQGLATRTERLADRMPEERLDETVQALAESYRTARRHVRDAGFDSWPRQVIHADWHPGNLVFQERRVLAVLDFDTARRVPRVIDVANGALQFSVTRTGLDPSAWPVELDRERLVSFMSSYDHHDGCVLSRAELRALPWLMIEGLIAEAVIPIVTTGRFGALRAGEFLPIVLRKAMWIRQHVEEITGCLENA